jgi:hypothetical protein
MKNKKKKKLNIIIKLANVLEIVASNILKIY